MSRRDFITLLGGAAAAWPLAARGQRSEKVWRIGMLETTAEALNAGNLAAFRRGLHSFGYVENENSAIEYRPADGRTERFADLAVELLRLGVDIIVARGTPATLAARDANPTIPIVMTSTAQPFVIVGSIARPGGNVTGLSSQLVETVSKRLELISELLPQLQRVAWMLDGRDPTVAYTARGIHWCDLLMTEVGCRRWFRASAWHRPHLPCRY
jgi:putative ABC transport system substrate-binding protein